MGHEGDPARDLGAAAELHDALDELLAEMVGGVGLAGEDQLQAPVGRVEERQQALGL